MRCQPGSACQALNCGQGSPNALAAPCRSRYRRTGTSTPRSSTGLYRHAVGTSHSARTTVVGVLLTASFFMAMVVVTATIGIPVDVKPGGNTAITTLLEASGFASVIGLLVGGCGLVLVIVERSRQ